MSIFIVVEISIFLTLLRFPSPNVYVGISCCFYCGKNGFIRYLFSNVNTLISSFFSTTRPFFSFLLLSSLSSPPKQSDHEEKMHNINIKDITMCFIAVLFLQTYHRPPRSFRLLSGHFCQCKKLSLKTRVNVSFCFSFCFSSSWSYYFYI